MDHIDNLISRVSCPCVKNSENQANQFFHGVYPMGKDAQIWATNPGYEGVYMIQNCFQ